MPLLRTGKNEKKQRVKKQLKRRHSPYPKRLNFYMTKIEGESSKFGRREGLIGCGPVLKM